MRACWLAWEGSDCFHFSTAHCGDTPLLFRLGGYSVCGPAKHMSRCKHFVTVQHTIGQHWFAIGAFFSFGSSGAWLGNSLQGVSHYSSCTGALWTISLDGGLSHTHWIEKSFCLLGNWVAGPFGHYIYSSSNLYTQSYYLSLNIYCLLQRMPGCNVMNTLP